MLRELVCFHACHCTDFSFTISDTPDFSKAHDVYVVPVSIARSLFVAHTLTAAPVIAFGQSDHLTSAFFTGCSDYLKEPWEFDELYQRLLRLNIQGNLMFHWGDLVMRGHELVSPFGRVTVSYHEALVLRILFQNRGTPVPRKILQGFLGLGAGVESRAVDMHVSNLRKKLRRFDSSGKREEIIRCIRGKGYCLVTDRES